LTGLFSGAAAKAPAPSGPHREMTEAIQRRDREANCLNPKERNFVKRMTHWRGEPSEAQQVWLQDIFDEHVGDETNKF
jgi:hypothetical protein